MKVTINTTETQSREIDWSKPMLVTNGDAYLLTLGVHNTDKFEGIRIRSMTRDWFYKYAFTPCTTPVTITFENEL